ncbi:MAG: hypothetical protein HON43_00770, partial [Alphaproteobacteria bacterium]|nr:hypothetical protein [Alphaproteobacteria bacterium]
MTLTSAGFKKWPCPTYKPLNAKKEKPSFLKTKMILDYVKSKSDFDYFVNLGVDKEISHFYNKKN